MGRRRRRRLHSSLVASRFGFFPRRECVARRGVGGEKSAAPPLFPLIVWNRRPFQPMATQELCVCVCLFLSLSPLAHKKKRKGGKQNCGVRACAAPFDELSLLLLPPPQFFVLFLSKKKSVEVKRCAKRKRREEKTKHK